MEQLIIIFHVLAALAITGLILIQQGKGADMGASFGGGASQTLFGSRGSGNVLTRATAVLATLFFATSFALAVVARDHSEAAGSVGIPAEEIDGMPVVPVDEIPAVEENAAPSAGDIPELEMAPADAPADIPELDASQSTDPLQAEQDADSEQGIGEESAPDAAQ